MTILYAKASAPQQVTAEQYVDINGLQLNLPASSPNQTHALLILSVTAPYARGDNNPGVNFNIEVNEQSVAQGGFTYNEKVPLSFGRSPFCMAVRVPLTNAPLYVEAQWSSVRGSTGIIDDFGYASLAAILG